MENVARYIVFDLDGCISDDRHRAHLRPEKGCSVPERYNAYNELCLSDKPMNLKTVNKAQRIVREDGKELIFVTARPQKHREATERWLWLNFGIDNPVLLMRPNENTQPSEKLKPWLLSSRGFMSHHIFAAYDDRDDVLEAYRDYGIRICVKLGYEESGPVEVRQSIEVPVTVEADTLLAEMAKTYAERNAKYKSNYQLVGAVMDVLHGENAHAPACELLKTADDFTKWHLYELMIVKLTRFANSGLKHADSIHDLAIYASMVEARVKTEEANNG